MISRPASCGDCDRRRSPFFLPGISREVYEPAGGARVATAEEAREGMVDGRVEVFFFLREKQEVVCGCGWMGGGGEGSERIERDFFPPLCSNKRITSFFLTFLEPSLFFQPSPPASEETRQWPSPCATPSWARPSTTPSRSSWARPSGGEGRFRLPAGSSSSGFAQSTSTSKVVLFFSFFFIVSLCFAPFRREEDKCR